MLEGWICPRCKRINAPWVEHCDYFEPTKTNIDICDHQWVLETVSTAGTTYRCRICDKIKIEPYNTDGYINNITNY